jgi:hypothetical protein
MLLALLALFLATAFFWRSAFAHENSKTKADVQWEYKVIDPDDNPTKIEEALNKVGKEGWECVSTVSRGPDRGPHLICKRAKK